MRRRHGVTQEQLAARARTSQAAISRIERGVVSPSVATLASLLDPLGEELELSTREIDDHLIAVKEASGGTEDKLMATEYRVLADEIRRPR